jgi:N-acetylneuraminic acid mutarotase
MFASAYAATPPYLGVKKTSVKLGSAVSGAAAHLDGNIYFAGGLTSSGSVTNAVAAVNSNTNVVTQLTPMPTARAGLGLVGFFYNANGISNALLAVGGTNGTTALGAVELYNPVKGSWSELAPLPTPRAYLSVVAGTDGKIYAIGGVDASGKTVGTVEIYNPTTNSWSEGPSLVTPRSHLAATLLYLDGIFVAGGKNASGTVLNTTELYNLQTGGPWVSWFPMNTPRADFGISLAADGYLHAFGGLSTNGAVKTVEGYRFTTGAWTIEQEKLPSALSGFAVTESLGGAVFVIGGKSGSTFETNVIRATAPFEPTHSVTYYVHSYDEPYVLGNFAMDQIAPLQGLGLLNLGLLSSTNFTTFPGVGGTIESGGSLTVNVPGTIIIGLINGLTVTAENRDGTDPVVIGSVSSLLGLSGNVNIPITTPLVLKTKVLVLTISSLLGVDLNLGNGYVTVTLNGLTGRPSNPQ